MSDDPPGAAPVDEPRDTPSAPAVSSEAPAEAPVGMATAPKRRRRKWPWITLGTVVLVIVLAWLGVNSYGAYWIAHNGYIGESEPAVSALGFPAQEVTFDSDVNAWYAPPSSGQPVAVIVHGFQANRAHVLPTAQALVARGYGVVVPDLAYVSGKTTFGGGDREANEVIAAVDYAHNRSTAPVVLIGYSEGGAEAVLAADRGAKVEAVVTDSSPISFVSIAAQRVGIPQGLFAFAYVAYPWFSGGAHLQNLADDLPGSYRVPTLVIQGTADTTVPYADGPTLARLTHGQLWTVQGVGHDKAFSANPSEYVARVTAFIQGALSAPGG